MSDIFQLKIKTEESKNLNWLDIPVRDESTGIMTFENFKIICTSQYPEAIEIRINTKGSLQGHYFTSNGKPKMLALHPGEILKKEYLKVYKISITELAKAIKVSRKTVSKIVNGHSSITPEITLKLEKALLTSTADEWLTLQIDYELEIAEQGGNGKR